MAFLDREVAKGRQGYIVYPIIEESEKLALKAATTMYEELSSGVLKGRRLALLHGRVAADEREAIMRRFRDGAIDAGGDDRHRSGHRRPNATVMIIEHPERFGLSQLHQLRGRVGRGAEESSAFSSDGWAGFSRAAQVLVDTDDGLRSPAPIFGCGAWDLFGERKADCRCSAWPIRSARSPQRGARGRIGGDGTDRARHLSTARCWCSASVMRARWNCSGGLSDQRSRDRKVGDHDLSPRDPDEEQVARSGRRALNRTGGRAERPGSEGGS
jgi:hypothetical protein